jgi:hypothetical protein
MPMQYLKIIFDVFVGSMIRAGAGKITTPWAWANIFSMGAIR